jgi:GT2 family glycosyltransferase
MCLSRRLIQDERLNFYPVKPTEYESEEFKQTLARSRLPYICEDYAYCLRARALGYGVVLDWSVYLDHLFPIGKRRSGYGEADRLGCSGPIVRLSEYDK